MIHLHGLEREEQREHELVFGEERIAHLLVQELDELILQREDAPLKVPLWLLGRLYRQEEYLDEPFQTVLIHRLHLAKVRNHEEHRRASDRDGNVGLPGLLHKCLRLLLLFHALFNTGRGHLRVREGGDELLVIQDVALGVRQKLQDLILDLFELRFALSALNDQVLALLLHLLLFLRHHNPQHLILKSIWSHHEVEKRDLNANLR
mmetsp:Transcript_34327/g.79162  ORF Transcript_34327/g.79162 Transcript_34327/m.79162 type:complete len:206 (-) Transcript_34327:270-887(-)